MIKFKTTFGVVTALLLSACSTQPRQVSANLPLVNERTSPIGSPVDKHYWPQLDGKEAVELQHTSYKISAQEPYTSALGIECRLLIITPSTGNKSTAFDVVTRTVCKHEVLDGSGQRVQGWFLIRDIVENSTAVEI